MESTIATMAATSDVENGSRGGIIDVHSHAPLPIWVEAFRQATKAPPGPIAIMGTEVPEWTPEKHIEFMNANNIAASVLSWPTAALLHQGQAARDLAREMNTAYADIVQRYPRRFGVFAILPLDDMKAALDEMIYALDVLKMDGVSLPTNVHGAYLGDSQFDELFAEMNKRKVTLFVHPSLPKNFGQVSLGLNVSIIEFMFDSTRFVTNMITSGAKKRFPDVNVITTHGGGTTPYLATRISVLEPVFGAGPGRGVVSGEDVLAQLRTFYFDTTASNTKVQLDALLGLVPATQLMLGSDFELMPVKTTSDALAEFGDYAALSESDRELVVSQNARRILPSLAARLG